MIDVVSDQSDFWNQESAMLQAENEELKKFIEDVENESDLKSVLGAVERRLLSTIRELRENEREYLREKKKSRGNDIESSRDSERLRQERVALINVIIVLQRENKVSCKTEFARTIWCIDTARKAALLFFDAP